MISDDFILELRDRTDIESIVSPYVNLKRRGKTLTGLCPFHSEKTPSFTVYPENNSFYCFGCGAGGSAITFVERIENLSYVDAVKSLAEKCGMNMPEDGYDDTLSQKRHRILAANREAAKFYHEQLLTERGKPALDYLLGRGFTMQTIRHFGMGFAPDSWDALLSHMQHAGYNSMELLEANLVRKSSKSTAYYDNFRNRVMTPIIDIRGSVVAFGGRVLDDSKPKYINTSDTLVYKKTNFLFALNFAKNNRSSQMILTEGYMDAIALHQAGFTNSVAGLGTALTNEQARLISRYADEVLLAYDSDDAGQQALRKAIAIFSRIGMNVRVLQLTGGKDPDEIIKKYGVERFQNIIDGAANDIEYKILEQREKFDLTTDDGKLNFMRAAAQVLAGVDGALERDIYASRLANEFSVSKDAILTSVNSIAAKRKKQLEKEKLSDLQHNTKDISDTLNPEKRFHLRAAKAEERLLSAMLNHPDLYKKISDKICPEDFVTQFNGRVFSVLSSRLSNQRSIELDVLADSFNPTEIGWLNHLLISGSKIGITMAECEDFINTILREKLNKEHIDPSQLPDEDWAGSFDKFKNK